MRGPMGNPQVQSEQLRRRFYHLQYDDRPKGVLSRIHRRIAEEVEGVLPIFITDQAELEGML